MKKSEKLTKLLGTVKKVKDALVTNWDSNNGSFVDKDNMTESGILSETIGLTGILLFLVAFNEEKSVINENDKEKIVSIYKQTFSKIHKEIEEKGFTAEPLVSKSDTNMIFRKDDGLGYIDTITWVLSATILTRYLVKNNVIELDKESSAENNKVLAEALALIINSQREDGTWGFLSDKKSDKSLYFTFAANASVADFFDYVMGEIAYVNDKNADDEDIMAEMDKELLEYLNKELANKVEFVDGSIEKTMGDVRQKLQDWLIKDCLPLLPELAGCNTLNDSAADKLGIWSLHNSDKYSRYFNLYYTYYLVEMMVTSSSDSRINELLYDDQENVKRSYLETMSSTDIKYYFSKNNLDSLWNNIMEQAIHNSRSAYMSASRTGNSFWDSSEKSSLKIQWKYSENNVITNIVESAELSYCFDPCLVPMALRSNIMYSYYISKQPDMCVDRLFDSILEQQSSRNGDVVAENLWDTSKFSLLVTERSVEALVDYYDYLVKFDESGENTSVSSTKSAEKSEFDIAMDKKIAEYLKGPAGKSIVESYIAESLKSVSVSSSDVEASIKNYMSDSENVEQLKNALGVEKASKNNGPAVLQIDENVVTAFFDHLISEYNDKCNIIQISGTDVTKVDQKPDTDVIKRVEEFAKLVNEVHFKEQYNKAVMDMKGKLKENVTLKDVYESVYKNIDELYSSIIQLYIDDSISVVPEFSGILRKFV